VRTGARRAARSIGEAVLRFGAPGRQVVLLEHPVDPKPRNTFSALRSLFASGIPAYKQTLREIAEATHDLDPDRLPWSNPFLPGLDAASLYGLIVAHRPRLYLEIGSGNSTIFARRAISDSRAGTRLVSIDPQPRAEVDALCDEVMRVPLQDVRYMSTVANLTSDDIVFIDGSHQSFPNSDVTVFFTEILPLLPEGVIVGIHDIYLPDDYPDWAAETLSNEQYLLAAWLLGRGSMDGVLLPCAFVHRYTTLTRFLAPLWARIEQVEPHGGTFWFKIPLPTPLQPSESADERQGLPL
jgi:predicted O-methyltransferase YrrM